MDFSNDSKLTKNRNDVEYLDLVAFSPHGDISLFGFTKIMLAQSDTPTRSVNLSFSLSFLSPPLYFFLYAMIFYIQTNVRPLYILYRSLYIKLLFPTLFILGRNK